MKIRAFLLVAIALPAVAQAPMFPSTVDPEPASFTGMTSAHNSWRARVGVPAVGWSDLLSQQAQRWADQLAIEGCRTLRYDPDPVRRDNFGQNIMNSWTTRQYEGFRKSPLEIVDRWGMDGTYFDAGSNSCTAPPGRQCGQYTQLVWDETRFLGCGRARCDNAEVWVCNYWPRGNKPSRRPYGNGVTRAPEPLTPVPQPLPSSSYEPAPSQPMTSAPIQDYTPAPVTPIK